MQKSADQNLSIWQTIKQTQAINCLGFEFMLGMPNRHTKLH
ncbi:MULTISPECIES: hypothetical protein [unclassified Moraxella]|nr:MULTISPECIES: hypothetical protein [unclassified Moraxella]